MVEKALKNKNRAMALTAVCQMSINLAAFSSFGSGRHAPSLRTVSRDCSKSGQISTRQWWLRG